MSLYRSPEKRASSLRRPPPAFRPYSSPCSFYPPHVIARSPAVCTRKRRGDGRHVCAMRTRIGVSLFRGGSDVLFHPRRRQSCRTAKTYHTIVSKFANSPISLVLFHLPAKFSLSLSFSLFFSPSLMTRPPTILIYLSLFYLVLFNFLQFPLFLFYLFLLPQLHVFYYSSSRFYFSILSLRKGPVVRAGEVFCSVYALNWKTSRKTHFVSFTIVGTTKTISENDFRKCQ